MAIETKVTCDQCGEQCTNGTFSVSISLTTMDGGDSRRIDPLVPIDIIIMKGVRSPSKRKWNHLCGKVCLTRFISDNSDYLIEA